MLESSRGIKLKGLFIFAIWMIFRTYTHPSTHAENLDPKKGRLGPQKGLTSLEKMKVFAITVRNSMGRYIHMDFRCYAPQPMDGYGGVLGSH